MHVVFSLSGTGAVEDVKVRNIFIRYTIVIQCAKILIKLRSQIKQKEKKLV